MVGVRATLEFHPVRCRMHYVRFLETLRTNLYGTDAEYTESIATWGKYAFETSVILGFDAAGLPVVVHRFRLRFF